MAKSTGLLGKFTRAFWLQVGLITVAAILGVYLAKITIEETLVKKAILEEADYFWKYYLGDSGVNLPDTKNLTGYFDPNELPPIIQDNLITDIPVSRFPDLIELLEKVDTGQTVTVRFVPYAPELAGTGTSYVSGGRPNLDQIRTTVQTVLDNPADLAMDTLDLTSLEEVCSAG